jgi:NTE family protein
MKSKDVALALSSGGPRGWAYIGAIEELESRGYRITSVAGTSIGSLIGGIYAAGKLPEVKEWLFNLDAWKVFSLMDISLSKNHLVKGDKVISALKEIVPDVDIRDLPIPYRAVAADLYTGEEVIFDRGPLFDAIRASISIPSLFRPVKYGYRTLVDGGIVNTMPISCLTRKEGDILVAFDVNDIDVDSIRQ